MVLAVVYGIYEFFFRSTAPEPEESAQIQVQQTREFTSGLSQTLDNLRLSPRESLVLEALDFQGRTNPFYGWPYGEPPVEEEPEEDQEEVDVSLVYQGYIEMDRARLAVINGREYQAGDVLPEQGLKIVNIQPDQVVLEFQSDKRRITLFFEDEFYGNGPDIPMRIKD